MDMSDISLCFEVHQPMRLKKEFFWDGSPLKRVSSGDLFDFYFDDRENCRIFERVSSKCYLPANQTILRELERFKECEKPFKVSYSFSGVLIDQCRRYRPEVLDSFVKLVDTGMVEVMEQTYYHSLASLYEDRREFLEQVKMHRELMWDVFAVKPVTFENTELIYDDRIARMVEGMGYRGIFTEGVVAHPNYLYRPSGTKIALMLRNFQLTDDVGFRFSSRWWPEYPLTSDKYAAWLSATPGQCINLFCDYETFGEHQWIDTGIFDFLRHLPGDVLKRENLRFVTPQELVQIHQPVREISVDKTVSWADLERDTSCWLGNGMQWACYLYQKRLEPLVKETQDEELTGVWRLMTLSDHLYYIFTHGGGPGEVHSYFSPYGNPYDAAVTYFSALCDLHFRVRERLHLADQPFAFSTGTDSYTGDLTWSLEGFKTKLGTVELASLEYHARSGDFAAWVRGSLGEPDLASQLERAGAAKGEALRSDLVRIVESRLQVGRKKCMSKAE